MDDVNTKLQALLHEHLENNVEKVDRLEGGMINYTFRLHLKNDFSSPSSENVDTHSFAAQVRRFQPTSLIMKMASPSMSFDASTPVPINRQTFEERALNLFHTATNDDSINLSVVLNRNKTIRIPRVWLRDKINNVLFMDDCGPLADMSQWLFCRESSFLRPKNLHLAQTFAEELATFIVDMQIVSLSCIDQLEAFLYNDEVQQCILTNYVRTIPKSLETCRILDADVLSAVAVEHFEYYFSHETTDGKVLVHGDLSPTAVLIHEHDSTLAIIDWEFCSALSPAWDPAFLLSYCHSAMVVSPIDEPHLRTFVHTFMNVYREAARKNAVSWYRDKRDRHLFAWSLGIVHGTLLINRASSVRWCICHDLNCSHVHTILQLGADYLRRCRSGPTQSTYHSISQDAFLGRLFDEPRP